MPSRRGGVYSQASGVPSRRRRFKIIIIVGLVLAVVVIIVLLIKALSSPAEGTISQAPPQNVTVTDPYSQPALYSGKYISFTYPAHYKIVATKLNGSYLELDVFYGTKDRSKQITVGVLREALSDDSGVAYRREHPELYHQETSSNGSLIFVRTDGHERTAYQQHSDLALSVAVTSSNLSDLTADSQIVLNSLSWK